MKHVLSTREIATTRKSERSEKLLIDTKKVGASICSSLKTRHGTKIKDFSIQCKTSDVQCPPEETSHQEKERHKAK